MRFLLVIIFTAIVITTPVFSQPTITVSNLTSIGMETIYKEFDAVNFVPGPTGASVTWDFSKVGLGTSQSYSYVDPATVSGHTDFPGSNLCTVAGGDYRIFMKKDSSGLQHIGSIYTISYKAIYSDYQEFMTLPMSYGDQDSETFSGSVTWGNNTGKRTGTTEFSADAYGDLILPNESLNGVLRVWSKDVFSDSLNGVWQGTYEYDTYQWFHPSRIDAVLIWRIVKSYSSNGTSIDTTGEVFDELVTGNEWAEHHGEDVLAYPNPCRNEFTLKLNVPGFSHLDIYDLSGRKIKSMELHFNKQFEESDIDVRDLSSGVYSLVIRGHGKAVSKRLVIRNSLF